MSTVLDDEIVISGMAINTPIGDTLPVFLDSLYAGRSALGRWHSLDVSNCYSKVGADLGDYDTEARVEALRTVLPADVWRRLVKLHVSLPWSTRITTLLAVDAFLDAGLFGCGLDPKRIAVVVAGHDIGVKYDYDNRTRYDQRPDHIDPLYGLQALDTDHPASVTQVLGSLGPAYLIGGACASGNLAVRAGIDELRLDRADAVMVVGPVLEWSPLLLHGMALLGAITFKNFLDRPEAASRPYDTAREGFVPAHGGGALVLERRGSVERRGAGWWAAVLGCEASSSASHLPTPTAASQAEAMRLALAASRITPDQVDYINAHATSTPRGDLSELEAIKEAFGPSAHRIPINAPKSLLGHTCWSAPIVELVAGVLQMNRGRIHRTANIDNLDPQVDLDVTADAVRDVEIRHMVKNSFGFGGLNCVSVLRRGTRQ